MIRVKLFGVARDIVGSSTLELEDEVKTVGELLDLLKIRYVQLTKLTSLLIAVNEEYAELSDPVHERDEIALIPPVSGG